MAGSKQRKEDTCGQCSLDRKRGSEPRSGLSKVEKREQILSKAPERNTSTLILAFEMFIFDIAPTRHPEL